MANPDKDMLAKTLKLKTLEMRFGHSRVQGVVEKEFLNGVGIAHGGYLFTLADFASARASNTDDKTAITSYASINFVAPCPASALVIAESKLSYSDAKSAVCDTVITNVDGTQTYAVFQSRVIFKK